MVRLGRLYNVGISKIYITHRYHLMQPVGLTQNDRGMIDWYLWLWSIDSLPFHSLVSHAGDCCWMMLLLTHSPLKPLFIHKWFLTKTIQEEGERERHTRSMRDALRMCACVLYVSSSAAVPVMKTPPSNTSAFIHSSAIPPFTQWKLWRGRDWRERTTERERASTAADIRGRRRRESQSIRAAGGESVRAVLRERGVCVSSIAVVALSHIDKVCVPIHLVIYISFSISHAHSAVVLQIHRGMLRH